MSHLDLIQQDDDSTLRHIIIGVHGVGKTSIAAGAPNVRFIAPAYELKGFDGVKRWSPSTYKEFHEVLDLIIAMPKPDFEFLAIDTVNWVQELAEEDIATTHGVTSFKKIPEKYNFKKWGALEMEAPRILLKLDKIRAKGISQFLLFHADVKKHTNPEGQEWDRYIPKGYKDFTGIFMQRSDSVMFNVYETFEVDSGNGNGKKKIVGEDRVLRTTWSHAYDAKNRLSLPDTIIIPEEDPYAALAKAIHENSKQELAKQFHALLKTSTLTEDVRAVWIKTPVETLPSHRIKSGIAKLEKLQPTK